MGLRTKQKVTAPVQSAGRFLQADYFENAGGLNTTDSPFSVGTDQATGGINYEYTRTGGIKSSLAPLLVNSVADAQLLTRGINLYHTKAGVKDVLRAATTKLQLVDTDAGTFTDLTEDTASAGSSLFSGSGQVSSVMFTTTSSDMLWYTGGGLTKPIAAYSTSKYTQNGAATPEGSITATPSATGGSFVSTGTYFYGVALYKASTGVISNVALDQSAAVSATTDKVTVDLSSITAFDQTKYTQIWIYRSAVGGSEGFTTGDIIAKVASSSTSYIDTGTSISSAQNVPRAGNTTLDNSELPAGTYGGLTIYKRRLVTFSESTLRFSDLNKPESWPSLNFITVPSGGKIQAVVSLGYNSPGSGVTDEFLAVFKENELWIITGDNIDNYELKFVDFVGCPGQNLVVSANGFIYWVDTRGVFMWDGSGKPIYVSRPIENKFEEGGEISKNRLAEGFGTFLKRKNQVMWHLTATNFGEQKFILKLDLQRTLPQAVNLLGEKVLDGVFLPGESTVGYAAGSAFLSPDEGSLEDIMFVGDKQGFIYKLYSTTIGTGEDVEFRYRTAHLDMGRPGIAKRFHKVIVWVDEIGNWDLNLNYWADYRVVDGDKTTQAVSISDADAEDTGIWGVGEWGSMVWGGVENNVKALVFNLNSSGNNNEGDALRLEFFNNNSAEPITINSFSVMYSELTQRK